MKPFGAEGSVMEHIEFMSGSRVSATPSSRLSFSLPRVSLVIPTLNEANNLRWLLPRLPSWIFEVIIVDGCSTDGTVEVARAIMPGVRILLQQTRGKGIALMTGFNAAEGDIIVMLDADGSMDPEEIIAFVVALMNGADLVKGSRFIQGAGTSDMTRFRMFGNWCLTQAFRTLYGGSFSDLCYGYIGFWRRNLPYLQSNCTGFEVETILNIKALQNRLKVVEVASFESDRLHGQSNLRALPDGWRILKALISEKFGRRGLVPAE